MNTVLAILFILMLVLLVWGLVAPHHLRDTARLHRGFNRKHAFLFFGSAAFVLLILVGVTAPLQPKPANIKTTTVSSQTKTTSKPPTITTKTITTTQSIPFTTKTQNDSSLPKGKTLTTQQGINGVETLTYKITYTNGKQTNKTLVSQVVTTQPTEQIVDDGTYVAPAPVSTPAYSSDTTGAGSSTTSSPPSGCYPLSDEGGCYEPGEYCRDSDHGATGRAGDGEAITCEDNDGWRWEPS